MNARLYLTSGLGLAALAAALIAPQLFPQLAKAGAAAQPTEVVVDADVTDAVAEAVADPEDKPVQVASRRDVDVVICLDTSGSMDNLIDSVRAKLWDIVNEVSELEPNARLRVGLITYGSPGPAGPDRGFVNRQIDLTDDLDGVYAKVMSVGITGGSEYVGWALNDAVQHMSWSDDDGAARIVFIAGNEGADQGRKFRDYRNAAATAAERGILINAIYAGSRQAGINEGWAGVATAGGGSFSHIDMARGVAQVAAPQDEKLRELNDALNASYVPYGEKGAEGLANQKAQDANAWRLGAGSGSSRAVSKMSNQYSNPQWDLVDAISTGRADIADLTEGDLPPELRGQTLDAKNAWIDGKIEQRNAVKAEIRRLGKKRKAHVDAERAHDGDEALDEAVNSALEEQL